MVPEFQQVTYYRGHCRAPSISFDLLEEWRGMDFGAGNVAVRAMCDQVQDAKDFGGLPEHVIAMHVLDQWQTQFDLLPPGAARNAAFHLLWYCKELALGRHPG